jgi:hypothetical protein
MSPVSNSLCRTLLQALYFLNLVVPAINNVVSPHYLLIEAMAHASTTTIPTAVILKGQANYFSWEAWVRSQCPTSLWKYFDPAGNAEMKEPELPSTRPSYAEVFDEQFEQQEHQKKQDVHLLRG